MPVPIISADDLHLPCSGCQPKCAWHYRGSDRYRQQGHWTFFGLDWSAAYIRHDAPRRGFLKPDFESDQLREASTFRVVELAENLFNLKCIDGLPTGI